MCNACRQAGMSTDWLLQRVRRTARDLLFLRDSCIIVGASHLLAVTFQGVCADCDSKHVHCACPLCLA
jgi:hypothetical protein